MTPVPWKLWEGQVVDVYFPLRQYLGGTERSAVYLTLFGDPEPRYAAIKLTLAETHEVDPSALWERAAQLSHPNLLRLLRTGSWQVNQRALRYVVTEYAEENLASVLAERPLTPTEVREMLQPLVATLSYIHSEGLVHGHVKPANILAVGDELKLSVDGISLVGESASAPGTPGPYDPPEFSQRGCSPVGDVWSFGVTLVEALTQQLPVLRGPKQEPELPASLPAEFIPLVRACLHPDPRRRAPLSEIVELFERAEPVTQVEPIPAEQPASEPPAASHRWLSLTLVSASALVLAGILAGPRLLHRPVASVQIAPVAAATVPDPPAVKAVKPPEPTPVAAAAPVEAAPPPVAPKPAPPRPTEKSVETAPGQVVHEVLPQAPGYALRTIRGKVRIQVRATVDASGHVSDATVESENSQYFAKLALAAARQWAFAEGPGQWLLRFEFTTAGATVRSSRVAQ